MGSSSPKASVIEQSVPQVDCQYFNGYKPCVHSEGSISRCNPHCPQKRAKSVRILVVHLGAIGAVVRSTSLLPSIHRKYPGAQIFWVTSKSCLPIFENNPLVDKVFAFGFESLMILQNYNFDLSVCIDKSPEAVGFCKSLNTKDQLGFTSEPASGGIVPANSAADYLWRLGLDNHEKFHVNQKPETELMVGAFEFGEFQRDEYQIFLSSEERAEADRRRSLWSTNKVIVGFNTGCSPTIPMKKWTIDFHRNVIQELQKSLPVSVVLLGGAEDEERNAQIAKGLNVIESPTRQGLRDGILSVEACDLVVSGDSLGMHIAIAQKKYVVAWFGPTCRHEIDLFDRGEALVADVTCGPCWKRSCQQKNMCYDQFEASQVIRAIEKGLSWLLETKNPEMKNQVPHQKSPRPKTPHPRVFPKKPQNEPSL